MRGVPRIAAAATRGGGVVFVAEDWSAPYAGAYGNPRIRTPMLNRLARRAAPTRGIRLTGRGST